MKRPARGFTLIELLVVFVILGLLGAMLFPMFKSMRTGGHQSAALSNMRSLGVALNLYTGEHNYTLPGRVRSDGIDRWPTLLATYLGDTRVYAAPGLPNFIEAKTDPLSNSQNNTSFIMNGFNDEGAFDNETVTVQINRFTRLSQIILFGMQIDTGNFYMDFAERNQDDVLKLDAYNNGSIYLFADGSSHYIPKAEYVAMRPETNLRKGDWLWLADKDYQIPQ